MQSERRSFSKLLIKLMLPIVLQNLVTAVVNSADVVMLARIGSQPLSASTLANQVVFVLTLFYLGFSGGASLLAAQYWGCRDTNAIRRLQGLGMRLSSYVSALFFLAAIFAPRLLMTIFTQDAELIDLGAKYLRTLAPGFLLMGLTQTRLQVMKAIGETKASAMISAAALLANIALNALSIYVLFPRDVTRALMGVGAATSVARVLEFALCVIAIRRGKGIDTPQADFLRTPAALKRDFWRTTWPLLTNYLVWGCANAGINAILGHMGTDVTAAGSVATTLRSLVIVVATGLGTAGSIMVGEALGAGQFDRARWMGKKLFKWTLLLGVASGAVLLLFMVPAAWITGLTGEAAALFRGMCFVCALWCIGKSFNSGMVAGVFSAGGDTRFGLMCDIVSLWLIVLPAGFMSAFVWHWPPVVTWLILCLDETLKLPFVIRRFYQYKWVNDLTRRS